MEDLPAIYQREEGQPGSFLRSLVGVLETTTQGLDARIASLGHHLNPSTADDKWLNYLAQWLGVPWDDALKIEQKRSILSRASELARNRGTRSGLETMLECLAPGKPRRFRVIDATADFGFVVVGGGPCAGASLPAILSGPAQWGAELDATAVLGRSRLAGGAEMDDGVRQHARRIQIEVAATAAEQCDWEPWLEDLISDMVPLGTKVDLHWVAPQALASGRLDGTMTLQPEPAPHLNADAVTGISRLPECGASISACGPPIGVRLC